MKINFKFKISSILIIISIFLASRPKNRTQKIDKDEDEDYFMDLKNDENLQEDDVTIELTENNEDDVQPTSNLK